MREPCNESVVDNRVLSSRSSTQEGSSRRQSAKWKDFDLNRQLEQGAAALVAADARVDAAVKRHEQAVASAAHALEMAEAYKLAAIRSQPGRATVGVPESGRIKFFGNVSVREQLHTSDMRLHEAARRHDDATEAAARAAAVATATGILLSPKGAESRSTSPKLPLADVASDVRTSTDHLRPELQGLGKVSTE